MVSQSQSVSTPAPEQEAATLLQIEALAARFAADHGFAIFALVARIKRNGKADLTKSITNVEGDFIATYYRKAWGAVDLLALRAGQSLMPFHYDSVDICSPANDWSRAMLKVGVESGYVIPVHAPDNQALYLMLAKPRENLVGEALQKLYYDAWIFLGSIYPAMVAIFGAAGEVAQLTERERQVLEMSANGQPIKVIAAALNLSTKTINNVIKVICGKYHVPNRSQAISRALADNQIRVFRVLDGDPLDLGSGR